jgi:exonuclease VII small subunit
VSEAGERSPAGGQGAAGGPPVPDGQPGDGAGTPRSPGGLPLASGERELALGSMSFEQLVDTLDDLARRIASGAVGIEEAAQLYEVAGAVHEEASRRLERLRAKVEGLVGGPGAAAGERRPEPPEPRDAQ